MNQLKGYIIMPRKRTGNPSGRPNIVWRESPTEQLTTLVPPKVKHLWKDDPDYNYEVKMFMQDLADKWEER